MVQLYARALSGQRAYGNRPQKRGKNVTLIGAISLEGIVAWASIWGFLDAVTFEAFIIRKLIPHLWPGATVVLDNCTSHKNPEIINAIHKVGAKVVYLPPYSPDFSPIENFWAKVKSLLKSLGARTYSALEEAIREAFRQVTVQDIQNWYTHCCYSTLSN